MLDYSQVADIYREESSSPQLAKLPPRFYEEFRKLLEEKRRQIWERSEDRDTTLLVEEYRRLYYFHKGILQKRLEKIFFHAARGTVPENLSEEEERLFQALTAIRESFVHEVLTGERRELSSPLEEIGRAEREEDREGPSIQPPKPALQAPSVEEKKEKEEGVPQEDKKEAKEGFIQVLITEYVDAYKGIDGKVYGPFREGERVELPKEEGEWLIMAGMAKRL